MPYQDGVAGFLHVLGLIVLFVVCLTALASMVLGVPGTVLIVVTALVYAWATGFHAVHWSTIGWLTLLAVVGEGLEQVAGAAGASGTRPSRRVTFAVLGGSLVGGVAGAPFFFGVGALLGALLGAFAAAAIAVASEGGGWDAALATGLAAMRGRLLGFVLKTAIAVVMIVWLLWAALSPPASAPSRPRLPAISGAAHSIAWPAPDGGGPRSRVVQRRF